MKRRYIYLTIVLIIVIVLYILTRGDISIKKHQKENASFFDANSEKQLSNQNYEETKNKLTAQNTFRKTKINVSEIYNFASLGYTNRAFVAPIDNQIKEKPKLEIQENLNLENPFTQSPSKEKSNTPSIKKLKAPHENKKLFHFNPFKNQDFQVSSLPKIENLSNTDILNPQKKITDVFSSNNKYTNSDFLKKRLKTKSGDFLNTKKLQKHLNFINLNPFRNVNLILEPRGRKGYDIELLTKDLFPLRMYIGSDDTGINSIGRNLSYTGFNLNKAFFVDSILSYQFTTSYDTHEFKSHTLHSVFYLPWENVLTVYGDYSSFEPDQTLPYLFVDKRFRIDTSFRYDICLPSFFSFNQDLIFGFDFKRANTNLPYSNISSIFDPTVNVSQLLLSYSFNWAGKIYQTKFILEGYFSINGLFPDQENEKFDQLRRYAQNSYFYSKAYFSNLLKLPNDFLVSLTFRGQISNSNLLPSEALAIGGYNSVRGYFENQLLADVGLIINAEIRTKEISLIPNKKIKDALQFILFFDYGLSSIYEPLLFEEKNQSLIGYGPAIRYDITPYFTTRLDWGFKGVKDPEYGKGDSLLHFSINISY